MEAGKWRSGRQGGRQDFWTNLQNSKRKEKVKVKKKK
jgi:hypothetical protein